MNRQLAADLSSLSADFPDPLRLSAELPQFLGLPIARKWISGGAESAAALLDFIAESGDPDRIRVAAILLFQFDPSLFREQLLRGLAGYPRSTIEALAPAFWLGGGDRESLAEDLVQLAQTSGRDEILLLLQHPGACHIRGALRTLIAQRRLPASLYALYALQYALAPEDRALLTEIARAEDQPELAAIAGLYLARLGFASDARRGLRAGLAADDEALRAQTYSSLDGLVPATVFAAAGYRPSFDPSSQAAAIEALLDALRENNGGLA